MMNGAARGLHRAEHRVLLAALDGVAACIAIVMALWVWSFTTGFPFGMDFISQNAAWLLSVPLWLFVVSHTRALQTAHSVANTIRGLLSAAAVLLAAYVALYFYAPPAALARLPALYFTWEAVLLTAGARLVYLYVLGRGAFRRNVVVVGDGKRARAALDLLEAAADTRVVAVVAESNNRSINRDQYVVQSAGHLDTLFEREVAEVVLAADEPPSQALSEQLLRVQERGIDVVPFSAEYEQRLQRVPVAHLDADWAFTSLPEWVRSREASWLVKRSLDVMGGTLGALVLLLIGAPIAAAIWLESGRPVFYRQQRLGRSAHPFSVWKFRTMIVGAESDGAQFARADDARVTNVGRWLRRSRVDELPQVLNVIRGEMSLVGPRPERPEFVEHLARSIPFYRTRLMVTPGLTGWAQVNADYGDSTDAQERKLEYDLYYIKHRSSLFDLLILARTIGTVVGLRGR